MPAGLLDDVAVPSGRRLTCAKSHAIISWQQHQQKQYKLSASWPTHTHTHKRELNFQAKIPFATPASKCKTYRRRSIDAARKQQWVKIFGTRTLTLAALLTSQRLCALPAYKTSKLQLKSNAALHAKPRHAKPCHDATLTILQLHAHAHTPSARARRHVWESVGAASSEQRASECDRLCKADCYEPLLGLA